MIIDQLSKEQLFQLEEYEKCKNDLIYFITHYIKIPSAGGDELFKLYDRQKEYLEFQVKEKHTIILKSRQTGASTCAQAYISWICTFYENAIIGIVSKSGAESSDFCRKAGDMIDKLPDWLRPEFKKRTEQTFILTNGCQVHSAAISPANPTNLLRGKSITLLITDEAAFCDLENALPGCGPALFKAQQTAARKGVPYGTMIISTPNRTTGIGKWYFDTWKKAQRGEGIYKPFILHWKQIPEFANDPDWYKNQCAILGNVKWKIAQELDMEFVASSDSFFDADIITQLNKVEDKPITTITINGRKLKIYEPPDREKFYLIGIDTASAAGSDSSTCWIMDYETGNQVAEFQDKLRVDEFCPIIEQICKIFPNNMLIPECNSYGNQVCEYLTKKGTYNLYQTKSKSNVVGKNNQKFRYGLYTNPMNRPLIIDALYTMVSENLSGIKSINTALELISLIDYGNGKIAADEGEHDDLVMAFAFCCYIRLYDPPRTLFSKTSSKEEKETISDVVNWNNEENGIVNIAPDLAKMYDNANDEEDPIKKQQMINKSFRKFISTNLEKLMEQQVDQNPNKDQGSFINLLDIMSGTRNTSWIQ